MKQILCISWWLCFNKYSLSVTFHHISCSYFHWLGGSPWDLFYCSLFLWGSCGFVIVFRGFRGFFLLFFLTSAVFLVRKPSTPETYVSLLKEFLCHSSTTSYWFLAATSSKSSANHSTCSRYMQTSHMVFSFLQYPFLNPLHMRFWVCVHVVIAQIMSWTRVIFHTAFKRASFASRALFVWVKTNHTPVPFLSRWHVHSREGFDSLMHGAVSSVLIRPLS